MIDVDDRLNIKKQYNDNCYVKLPRSRFTLVDGLDIKMVIKNENFIKEIFYTDIDIAGIYFLLDDTIPKGNYTYSVIVVSPMEKQEIFYGRGFVCE